MSSVRKHSLSMRRRLRRIGFALYRDSVVVVLVLLFVLLCSGGGAWRYISERRSFASAIDVKDFVLNRSFEAFIGVWAFAVGSCIASFINVVAYRVPRGLSVNGHSICPNCKNPIRGRDNLPVLGWWFLNGRCHFCHIAIPLRYPVFEAIGGFIATAITLSTVLGQGFNLANLQHRFIESTTPYGIHVNLSMFDPAYVYIAVFHLVLIMVLYASGLTQRGGGSLPATFWFIAWLISIATVVVYPSLLQLPAVDWGTQGDTKTLRIDVDNFNHLDRWEALTATLTGSLLGLIAGLTTLPAWIRLAKHDQTTIDTLPSDDGTPTELTSLATPTNLDSTATPWILSWMLIGACLGWQSVVWVFAWTALLQTVLCVFRRGSLLEIGFRYKPDANRVANPIQALWLGTLLHTLFWSMQDRWLWVAGTSVNFAPTLTIVFALYAVLFACSAWSINRSTSNLRLLQSSAIPVS